MIAQRLVFATGINPFMNELHWFNTSTDGGPVATLTILACVIKFHLTLTQISVARTTRPARAYHRDDWIQVERANLINFSFQETGAPSDAYHTYKGGKSNSSSPTSMYTLHILQATSSACHGIDRICRKSAGGFRNCVSITHLSGVSRCRGIGLFFIDIHHELIYGVPSQHTAGRY